MDARITDIIEVFEDFLQEKGITIENPDKAQSEDPGNIYGTDYGDLYEAIADVLKPEAKPQAENTVTIPVSEFIKQEIDVDVYDDVCESVNIAFCGPVELTEEGKDRFGGILDLKVYIRYEDGNPETALLLIGGYDDWEAKLDIAKEFFDAAAGYCASSDYDRWFK